ncbi:cytochrome c maturation protein CcmE [Georhizobium profundi]|jgi:cytochrome c-type biogenesis protein CcmE|uniref:Cytochrome c-type biogenesis protein CcmE n=1 Tax=Georhizobium profundi TaxID=2341112 RepID=A0A3S9B6Y1_9HYPH|nr:cytochrome c maturation protein CcmE [Georhizobium profundi]AZN72667.1 cytochrome c maturation protein CcmE [Georhizobium profundi]GLQ38709.1 cytochrome c-type biogenesis protein CcmE [Rhizobium albus]
MTRKQKRLAVIAGGMGVVAVAAALVLVALRDEIVFFHSPSDLLTNAVEPGTRIRLGGLVANDSLNRSSGTLVRFAIEDGGSEVEVEYNGILPDLFREGQGVITEGAFQPGSPVFVADTVLAKHDENYMPREVADSLREQGVWQGEGEAN